MKINNLSHVYQRHFHLLIPRLSVIFRKLILVNEPTTVLKSLSMQLNDEKACVFSQK